MECPCERDDLESKSASAFGKGLSQQEMPKVMKAMKAMKSSSSKAMKAVKKPLQKGKTTMKKTPPARGSKTTPLKKGNLKKLGQLSLKDKMKKIAEEQDDEMEAAIVLRDEMTAAEKNSSWQKHAAHLKKPGNEAEKKEFEESSKKDKGLKTALYLMRTEAAKFCSVSKQTSLENSLCKKEKWLSEKQALDKWGRTDLDKHLESGRVTYRQAAGTSDVWEYMDTQEYTKAITGKHSKNWLQAQEFEQKPEEEDAWDKLLGKDLMGLLSEQCHGKGAPAKGSGKGNTKNKRNTPQPALEDMSPEEQLHEGLKKMKKTKELVVSTCANYEEALEKVKKCHYLSKPALKEKEQTLKALQGALDNLKKHLAKGDKLKLEKAKEVLVDTLKLLKDAKEDAKELVQISFKTQSKVSNK